MIRPSHRNSDRSRGRFVALAMLGLVTGGCTDAAGYDLDYILGSIPVLSTMRTTVGYESQTLPRLPAAGTVPIISPAGEVIAPFTQAQLDSAAATLSNPLPASAEVRARGAVVYQNHCFACHGGEGAGNGPVVGGGRFPLGPPVVSPAAVGLSDGYLYAIVRAGRGLMPAYGDRIGHNDRWALVHYIRELQGRVGTLPGGPGQAGAAAPVAPAPGTAIQEPGAGPADPAVPAPGTPGQ